MITLSIHYKNFYNISYIKQYSNGYSITHTHVYTQTQTYLWLFFLYFTKCISKDLSIIFKKNFLLLYKNFFTYILHSSLTGLFYFHMFPSLTLIEIHLPNMLSYNIITFKTHITHKSPFLINLSVPFTFKNPNPC